MQARWLDQLVWMEGAAKKNQRYYYIFRLSCIIGGVMIPALVSLNAGALVQFITVALSLVVAVSAAVEEFFHFGERWRHYRRSVGQLKVEGWLFFQLSGPYSTFSDHAEAYSYFAERVEETMQSEMDKFISTVAKEEKKKTDAK